MRAPSRRGACGGGDDARGAGRGSRPAGGDRPARATLVRTGWPRGAHLCRHGACVPTRHCDTGGPTCGLEPARSGRSAPVLHFLSPRRTQGFTPLPSLCLHSAWGPLCLCLGRLQAPPTPRVEAARVPARAGHWASAPDLLLPCPGPSCVQRGSTPGPQTQPFPPRPSTLAPTV